MDGMLEALDKNPPRLISLARIRQDWNADFLDWVHGNYRLVLNDKLNGVQLYLLKKRTQ